MKRSRVILLILVLAIAGCGKSGPPTPPVPIIPKETTDLEAIQRGPKLVLEWTYPAYTTTGMSLPGIKKIVVLRAEETLPKGESSESTTAAQSADIAATTTARKAPAATTTDATSAKDVAGSAEPPGFDETPVLVPKQFEKIAVIVGEIAGRDLPGFVEGARILFTERPPIRTTGGGPIRYTYAVITVGNRGRSALSNLATIVPEDAPLPPSRLSAKPTPPAVVLTWTAPTKSILGGAAGPVVGYNIYRLPPVGASKEPLDPVNSKPIEATEFKDRPAYGTYRYAVTAVVHAADPRIESELPLLVEATFEDLLPPPAPANLNALVEEDAVRLVWDAVSAPDFSGYKVYREEGGSRTLLTQSPIKETFFVDSSPVKGKEVTYLVTSIDLKGNESEPSKTPTVLVAE